MIAPVNVPPSQLQVIQGPSLDKFASSAPNISTTPILKKRTQPVLRIAQASITLNQAVTEPQAGLGNEPTQFPKARILPSPLATPKELPKTEELKPDQLNPNFQSPGSGQLLPGSQPFDSKSESKEQPKPETQLQSPDPFSSEAKPAETKPEIQPLVPEIKEQQKPEQTIPEAQPPENLDTKQDSKPIPPPLPSEIFSTPSQPQNPLPSGPPKVEPGNYPDNTGPGAAYYNQNYISPSVSFGKDTLIGATSRFGIGKNISVRPSLFLGNTARIAVPITYDFGFNDNEQFEKNPLVVFHAGAGLDYSSRSGSNTSSLNPLVVFGADVYLGDGASVLLQIGNTFNSDFVAVAGIGLQF